MHGVHVAPVQFRIARHMNKPKIRKSYIFDQYAVIAPRRDLRPRDLVELASEKSKAHCPFCPQNLPAQFIIDQASLKKEKDEIRVVKNIFPAATLNSPEAYGDQEVIIETKDHDKKMANFSVEQIEANLIMSIRRLKEYEKNSHLNYFLSYKNQGANAGASLKHPHSQNLALKIIPAATMTELALLKKYRTQNKKCAYCQILKDELKSARAIYEDKLVGAFAPYASQYHFEAWIFPKRHITDPAALTAAELSALAKVLKRLAQKIDKFNIAFNYFFYFVRNNQDQHFYIKFQPRDAIWAGVELGSGLIINEIAPETAAKFYKK